MTNQYPLDILLIAALTASLTFTLLWLWQLKSQNATLVDAAWGGVIGLVAIYYAVELEGAPIRRIIAALFGGVWGLRLAWCIASRHRNHGGEDGRYAHMRTHYGSRASSVFLFFFQIQALAVVICSLPFAAIASDTRQLLGVSDLLGISLWTVSLLGETIADYQLALFKDDPTNRGQACRSGLWRYSRHPNYFFEWLHGLSYVVLTLHTDYFWLTSLVALFMLLMLVRFSGIPHTEAQALRSRGDDYRRYMEETNLFFPWPPRSRPTNSISQ